MKCCYMDKECDKVFCMAYVNDAEIGGYCVRLRNERRALEIMDRMTNVH